MYFLFYNNIYISRKHEDWFWTQFQFRWKTILDITAGSVFVYKAFTPFVGTYTLALDFAVVVMQFLIKHYSFVVYYFN